MSPRSLILAVILAVHAACAAPDATLLRPLGDEEFSTLLASLGEPPGSFEHADNLVSNETQFAEFVAGLDARGGAYIGVGPEQNFSYIARIKPVLAFIVDIREDNRNLHLLYKALFELSADRADFVARLFSRDRPVDRDPSLAVEDLFTAIDEAKPSPAMLEQTINLIRGRLVETRGFALATEDLLSIEQALQSFYSDGPDIRYGRALPPSETRPSYRRLMTGRDHRGVARSFLASEDAFATVRDLHMRNRIVPIVGDFAGPHAIRRVGEYVRQQGHVVTAFYASNVEVYLTRDQRRTFCGSLSTLPHDDRTVFVGNRRLLTLTAKLNACATIRPSLRWP